MTIKDIQKIQEIDDDWLDEDEEREEREKGIAADSYYYYDTHPTKKDLMSDTEVHYDLNSYLKRLLLFYYRVKGCYVGANISIYQTPEKMENPIAPDVMVVKDVVLTKDQRRRLKNWKMRLENRPAPTVVFEVSSGETWKEDLRDKPAAYFRLGVKEYIAYDPNEPTVWRENRKKVRVRLRAWTYKNGKIEEMQPNERGWIWSEELDSWLVPDDDFLRLYDRDGNRRLTEEETKQLALEAEQAAKEIERAAKEIERAAKEIERAAFKKERAAKEAERANANRERAAKEAERAAKERAWAKLRELGIDPETLEIG